MEACEKNEYVPTKPMIDSVVEEVRQKFADRAMKGYTKYNATMDRDDLSIDEWLEHAQEEAMDFILYITKIRKELASKKFCECPNV
jgi:hypothetical protein